MKIENQGVAPKAERYLPQNTVSGVGAFSDVMQGVESLAKTAGSFLTGGVIGGVSDIGGFQQLLNQQMEVQLAMQTTSMQSNVEKSKHETRMAPIRNIRVS